jgi:hypothetical protein
LLKRQSSEIHKLRAVCRHALNIRALNIMDKEHTDEEHTMDIESSQEISLDNWGKQLLENILLTAAEAVGERKEISDSIEVTLTFRLTPILSKDHLEVSVAFERDPTLITHIPRQF